MLFFFFYYCVHPYFSLWLLMLAHGRGIGKFFVLLKITSCNRVRHPELSHLPQMVLDILSTSLFLQLWPLRVPFSVLLTRQKRRESIYEWLTSTSLLPPPVCLPVLCRALRAGAITPVYLANLFMTHGASPSFPPITLRSALDAASSCHSDNVFPPGPGVKKWGREVIRSALHDSDDTISVFYYFFSSIFHCY